MLAFQGNSFLRGLSLLIIIVFEGVINVVKFKRYG